MSAGGAPNEGVIMVDLVAIQKAHDEKKKAQAPAPKKPTCGLCGGYVRLNDSNRHWKYGVVHIHCLTQEVLKEVTNGRIK